MEDVEAIRSRDDGGDLPRRESKRPLLNRPFSNSPGERHGIPHRVEGGINRHFIESSSLEVRADEPGIVRVMEGEIPEKKRPLGVSRPLAHFIRRDINCSCNFLPVERIAGQEGRHSRRLRHRERVKIHSPRLRLLGQQLFSDE